MESTKTAADVEDAVEDTVEVTLAARYVVIEAFLYYECSIWWLWTGPTSLS